jgi:hypothetical protein
MKHPLVARLGAGFLFVFALVACLGCQQLDSALGGGSNGDGGTTMTVYGSVCCGDNSDETCSDGLPCCTGTGDMCANDYECCAGLCSGGMCAVSDPTLTAELGSRCTSTATCGCSITADGDDCFQGVCSASVVTSAGKRCCLDTGVPCGADGDCCSDQCDSTMFVCD